MFPLSVLTYVKIGGISLVLLVAFGLGWHLRDNDYQAFKTEVNSVAKAQEANVASITKQQAITTKGIQDEYEAKLAAVRNYYKSTSVWNNTSSGKVSGISPAPSVSDVIASYNVLAGQCAETTAQTVELQKWILEQAEIK